MNKVHFTLFLSALFLLAAFMVGARLLMLHAEHLEPEQPVAFSHTQHVKKVGLDCTYCHAYADKGPQATVPAMSVCASCHENMQSNNPAVIKLQKFIYQKEPVPWVRIHQLPGHVAFTHKRHIRAGVSCTVCHGEVSEMSRIKKVRTFDMGFCVSCHEENKAPTDCAVCHR